MYYCFSNGAVGARAACPSSSLTSGRHSQQSTESVSITKNLSSISWNEKLCGFADDLLSRRIQYISSSQTILQPVGIQYIHSDEAMFCRALQLTFTCSDKNNHTHFIVLVYLQFRANSIKISHLRGQHIWQV